MLKMNNAGLNYLMPDYQTVVIQKVIMLNLKLKRNDTNYFFRYYGDSGTCMGVVRYETY